MIISLNIFSISYISTYIKIFFCNIIMQVGNNQAITARRSTGSRRRDVASSGRCVGSSRSVVWLLISN